MKIDFKLLAESIVERVGGRDNILKATHCITRLRLVLKDESLADDEDIKGLKGVSGVYRSAEQYQVIVGGAVDQVHEALSALLGTEGAKVSSSQKPVKRGGFKHLFGMFAETVSGIFAPVLPGIIGCGLVTGFRLLLVNLNVISDADPLNIVLTVFGDAGFFFLPFLVAASAAKRFKANAYVAMAIIGILMHPNFAQLIGEGVTELAIFGGLPVILLSYGSTIIPAIVSIYVLGKFENYLKKIVPRSLHAIIVPFITFLVIGFLTLVVVGPLGVFIGDIIARIYYALFERAGLLSSALLGAFYPFMVMTGTHMGLFPAMIDSINTRGYDFIMALWSVSNAASAGAILGVYFKSRNKETKAEALSFSLITGIGLTEPGLYGVILKYKKPLIASIIGGGIGGLIFGWFQVRAYGIGFSPLGAIPIYIGETFVPFIVGTLIAAGVATAVSYVLGFGEEKEPILTAEQEKAGSTTLKTPSQQKKQF